MPVPLPIDDAGGEQAGVYGAGHAIPENATPAEAERFRTDGAIDGAVGGGVNVVETCHGASLRQQKIVRRYGLL